jgi:hypothetical protein
MFKKIAALGTAALTVGLTAAQAAVDTTALEAVGDDITSVGTIASGVLAIGLGVFIGMKLIKKAANKAS